MEIHDLAVAYFSPTGTSRKVAEAVASGVACTDVLTFDLTHSPVEAHIGSDSLAIVAVPVYGGHLPQLAVERLQGFRSDGAPAVAVVVYGNRAYEHALVELSDLLSGNGFNVVAAGTFIGEHSYSSEQTPIAAGRPDADDLRLAGTLGMKVSSKLSSLTSLSASSLVDVRKIREPSQPLFATARFTFSVMRMIMRKVIMPPAPLTDASLCLHCGKCVDLCPAGAIKKGEEQMTDKSKCIKCCACVKGCPARARTFPTPFAKLLAANFKYRKSPKLLC